MLPYSLQEPNGTESVTLSGFEHSSFATKATGANSFHALRSNQSRVDVGRVATSLLYKALRMSKGMTPPGRSFPLTPYTFHFL
jgi:hypothetical protein